MRIFFSVVILMIFAFRVSAQEFRARVTIQTPALQKADPKVFETLENSIQEFYNNTNFTGRDYEEFEKINLDINLTISKEFSQTFFQADLAIQATRPVYASNYSTPILTHIDREFAFDYEQFAPIDFSENSFTTNLSSLLTFYGYLVLGLDADSFAPFGGETHLQAAREVVNVIPQNLNETKRTGWRSIDSNRNRYWLIDDLLNPRLRDFRQTWYDYHRQGLDIMASNAEAGRAVIAEIFNTIGTLNRSRPNTMILQVFSNTKSGELVEIFKRGDTAEQNLLISTMTKVDPANAAKYRQVK